jgi:Ni,Fe-hydrogenase I cytochrome b subunit
MTIADPTTAGITLITLAAVAFGGTFVLRVSTGTAPANELQRRYYRAGHAHAGMLITLGLLIQVLTSDSRVPTWGSHVGAGVLWAAIVMPAGFFLSVTGHNPARPNRLCMLIWLGAASLVVGVIGSGTALIIAGHH